MPTATGERMPLLWRLFSLFMGCWVGLTEAAWTAYVVFQLFGWRCCIISGSAFFMFSSFAVYQSLLQASVWLTGAFRKILVNKRANRFKQLVMWVLLSMSCVYCIFVFRNAGLFVTGLMLSSGYSWFSIYIALSSLVGPSAIIVATLFWAETSFCCCQMIDNIYAFLVRPSRNKKNNWLLIMLRQLTLVSLTFLVSQVFVSMFLRSALGFAGAFFHKPGDIIIVTTLAPPLFYILSVTLFVILFFSIKDFFDIVGQLYTNLRDKKGLEFFNTCFYIFCALPFVCVRVWASQATIGALATANHLPAWIAGAGEQLFRDCSVINTVQARLQHAEETSVSLWPIFLLVFVLMASNLIAQQLGVPLLYVCAASLVVTGALTQFMLHYWSTQQSELHHTDGNDPQSAGVNTDPNIAVLKHASTQPYPRKPCGCGLN